MPARSGNTHLERIRVRTGLQHVRVMVALQHDHFTAAQKLGRIARHKAKVGRKAEPAAAVLEYVARALGCVMRRRKRHNVHIPDPEALTAVEYVQTVGVLRILFLESLGCAASGKHRRLRFFKKHRQSLHMVDVLMRQHHRRNILQRERQCLQRSRNPAQRHTEIDQNRGAVRHI